MEIMLDIFKKIGVVKQAQLLVCAAELEKRGVTLMTNAQKVNFKTPSGLKIRLNHRYFFYQLTKADRYYTNEEIVNDDTMYNAVASIETMFLIPTMLIQLFSLIAVAFHIETQVFCIGMVLLYAFGCVWRYSKQDFILSTILMFFTTLYKMAWWIVYIALIALVFMSSSTYLIIPYTVMRITLFIVSAIENHFILTHTMKKYGMPFNDTEICAFRVFHLLSKSDLRMSDYIRLYVEAIKRTESENTK